MSELLTRLKSEWRVERSGALARVPLYHQLYAMLKDAILSGTVAQHEQLPTEQQLAAAFEVSRITAKRAMDELAAESLITRFRGKGSHVIYQHATQSSQGPPVGMLESLADMGRHGLVRVVHIETVIPPRDVRALLEIDEHETANRLVRVRSHENGEPYAYYVSWTTGDLQNWTRANLERTPRLQVMRDNGINIAKIRQTLSAKNASIKVAAQLGVEPGSALLSVLRQARNAHGVVVDVLDCLYNPERYQYAMVVDVE